MEILAAESFLHKFSFVAENLYEALVQGTLKETDTRVGL